MAASLSSKSFTVKQRRISWNNFNLGLTTSNRSHVLVGGIISAKRLAVNSEIKVVQVAGYSAVKPHSVLNIVE